MTAVADCGGRWETVEDAQSSSLLSSLGGCWCQSRDGDVTQFTRNHDRIRG